MKRISWRLGGRHTQRPAPKPFISAVSALQPTEAVQSRQFRKTCVRPTILSIFIGCTVLWIWMNLVQVWLALSKETGEEQEVEMDIIWNEENFMAARRPPHTTTSSKAIYLSLCQPQQKRLFNLDASENLCETDNPFHFQRLHCALNLHEFGSSMTRSFKRSMWRAGSGDGHHMEWREFRGGSAAATQRPALKPFISAHVSLQQKRLFNLDGSENLCETDNPFHFHRLHCVLNLDEFGSSTTRSFKKNTWRAGSGDGHHTEWREFHGGSAAATHSDQLWSHLSQPMSACSNSAVAPLIWTARESDRGGVGCWISTLQWTSVTPAFNSGFHRFALGYDRSV